MKNDTQDIMTNMAEGKYTDRMNGPRDLQISIGISKEQGEMIS